MDRDLLDKLFGESSALKAKRLAKVNSKVAESLIEKIQKKEPVIHTVQTNSSNGTVNI